MREELSVDMLERLLVHYSTRTLLKKNKSVFFSLVLANIHACEAVHVGVCTIVCNHSAL